MKRRHFLKSITACATALTLPRPARSAEKQPNFVFIFTDDMGWTGLSVQMHDAIPGSKSDFYQTPHTERLARQGIRFSSAYAPAPMCTPTRASVLTGKSPAQLHITTAGPTTARPAYRKLMPPEHSNVLPADAVTIAEILKRAGYATAHLGKWHLRGGGPGAHGFDLHDGDTANDGPGVYEDPNPKDIFGITERATTFMKKQSETGAPFYLQLSHYAVHLPTRARSSAVENYADHPPGKAHSNIAYAAMTEDLDTSVGQLLDKIDALGIADNTYIIYMSDNGAGLRYDNSPLRGGKASLWEGGIRVPLIIRGPGIAANRFAHTPVVGWDLFPTICELAGVDEILPDGVEGGSLVALLKNGGKGEVTRLHEGIAFHFPHYGRGPGSIPQSSIRLGDYKLLKLPENDEVRLFNLKEDIGESRDLSQSMPEKTTELHRRLNDYLAAVNAQLPTINPDYDPSQSQQQGRRRGGQQGRRPRQGQGRGRRSPNNNE